MKKSIGCLILGLSLLPLFSACGKYDYLAHLSDVRSDIFLAETEDFTLTVSCLERERPFAADGIAAPRGKTVEAVLSEKVPSGAEYELYFLGDTPRGGDMSFRNVTDDYYYSRGVSEFPQGAISLRVVKDGAGTELVATSVKNEATLSPEEALDSAIKAEKETVDPLMQGGIFHGEFHVRLVRRDKNYYYVGIVDERGGTTSLLLDGESGAVLARRKN